MKCQETTIPQKRTFILEVSEDEVMLIVWGLLRQSDVGVKGQDAARGVAQLRKLLGYDDNKSSRMSECFTEK